MIDGQVLQQALRNTAELNIHMVGTQLSAYGIPASIGGSMQRLITRTSAQRLHAKHPKTISIGSNDMDSLAKTQLNLEAVAVKLQDLQGRQ